MSERYIVFDVETPNSANDRICAIGISVVESGRIDKEYACLVNPETDFDAFNVALTGITPGAVQDKPTFPELWTEIKPIFNSGLLIAHNAPFDMSVLAKCLKYYNIEWQPYTYYACTCRMSRECFPNIENYKLNTLCDYLHITLDHHQAHSDSHACAELLLKCLDTGVNPDQVISTYDFENIATTKPSSSRIRTSTTSKKLLELKCLLTEISADSILSESEVNTLQAWINQNLDLRGNFPFDKIFDTVSAALADGILESSELSSMLQLFEKITDPVANRDACTDFIFTNKTFCLSGEFEYGEKSKVEALLIEKGATPVKSVTKKTDYVLVGGKGNAAWCAGNYGTKVKKALELQEKGCPIQIVKEQDIVL